MKTMRDIACKKFLYTLCAIDKIFCSASQKFMSIALNRAHGYCNDFEANQRGSETKDVRVAVRF
jgi:hypothetical protein